MTKLAEAERRFATALDTLNKAVGEAQGSPSPGARLKTELSALKSEREVLLSRITALEDEAKLLAGLTEEVEDRLDDAIAEIRQVLAHN